MMENLQQSWKQTTANLYKAVLIYTVAGIASSVFSFILAITATASVIAALSSGEVSTGGLGLWSLLNIAATVAIVYGYWLFIKSLDLFKGMVDPSTHRASAASARPRSFRSWASCWPASR